MSDKTVLDAVGQVMRSELASVREEISALKDPNALYKSFCLARASDLSCSIELYAQRLIHTRSKCMAPTNVLKRVVDHDHH